METCWTGCKVVNILIKYYCTCWVGIKLNYMHIFTLMCIHLYYCIYWICVLFYVLASSFNINLTISDYRYLYLVNILVNVFDDSPVLQYYYSKILNLDNCSQKRGYFWKCIDQSINILATNRVYTFWEPIIRDSWHYNMLNYT